MIESFVVNIAAGVGQFQPVPVKGSFVYYKSGSGSSGDGRVLLRSEQGGVRVRLSPGDFIRVPAPVQSAWTIEPVIPGEGIAGELIVADGEFGSQNIAGVVQVIDGGRARTLAGTAFYSYRSSPAVAANYSRNFVWNPAGSGKRVLVKTLGVVSSAACTPFFGGITVAPGTVAQGFKSKLYGPVASATAARNGYDQIVAPSIADQFGQWVLTAGVPVSQVFQEPFVILPGYGLGFANSVANQNLDLFAEVTEESL